MKKNHTQTQKIISTEKTTPLSKMNSGPTFFSPNVNNTNNDILKTPNITNVETLMNFSSNIIEGNMPNIEMSCYLKEKVNVLEKENKLLKNELAMKMSKFYCLMIF